MDGGNAIARPVGAARRWDRRARDSSAASVSHRLVARDRTYGLSASAGADGWTPEYFSSRAWTGPDRGINSAGVPGTVSGWDALLKRFCSIDFEQVSPGALHLAEEVSRSLRVAATGGKRATLTKTALGPHGVATAKLRRCTHVPQSGYGAGSPAIQRAVVTLL